GRQQQYDDFARLGTKYHSGFAEEIGNEGVGHHQEQQEYYDYENDQANFYDFYENEENPEDFGHESFDKFNENEGEPKNSNPEEQEIDENFEGWNKKSFSNREEFEQKHNFQPEDQEQELENLIFSAKEVEDKTVEEPEVSLEEFIVTDQSSFTSSVTSTLISSS